ELHLAENVEDLAAQRLPCQLELLEELLIDVAFSGLLRDKVPEVTDLRLTNAMDAAEALLEPIGIPWQVVVHHQVRTLQVDTFTRGVGGEEDLYRRIVPERLLCL